VWTSTLDRTQISHTDRVVFHTIRAQLRRPFQRLADIAPGILPQFGQ
jgi:hypothetical protein